MKVLERDYRKALELYGQHHEECASVWPEKPCDCGLADLVDKPPLELKQEPDEIMLELHDPGFEPSNISLVMEPGAMVKHCSKCGDIFVQLPHRGRPYSKCPSCR